MPFRIVRNDITKMKTEAIVNTANSSPIVGSGCDHAIYEAAGYDKLLAYRKEKIGSVPEGEVFLTPGFDLPARYIIHAVSPLYIGGDKGEEKLLRSCYRKSLALAEQHHIRSIAFPLISTGGFGYPKEEGMRIAVDEIHAFLLRSDMEIFLVVFGEKATHMGKKLYPDLEAYIDHNYVREKEQEEYDSREYRPEWKSDLEAEREAAFELRPQAAFGTRRETIFEEKAESDFDEETEADFEKMEKKLEERMNHMSDTFQQYLLYLIHEKGMKNSDVYKRAIVDKKVFSKIKNNPDYHPQKLTALCLCVGARLNMDESRDLLARAGYALSPCDKTDIIFSYFIENGIYDMIELDIQLEEHGLPCIIP
ncbi:MAG: macro domain-containing protein [Eubacterium sp.]|nr:macro domain-containing protein [Eubacterium sp.]